MSKHMNSRIRHQIEALAATYEEENPNDSQRRSYGTQTKVLATNTQNQQDSTPRKNQEAGTSSSNNQINYKGLVMENYNQENSAPKNLLTQQTTVEILIPGKPIGKKRPKFARRGNAVVTYNEQETEEGKFLILARQQLSDSMPWSGPLEVVITACMPRPKNHSGKRRGEIFLKKSAPIWHEKKPDADNIAKFVLDCLNGAAWADDSQVAMLSIGKIYPTRMDVLDSYTHVKITRLKWSTFNKGLKMCVPPRKSAGSNESEI